MVEVKVASKKRRMGQIWREEAVLPVTYLDLKGSGANFVEGDKIRVTGVSKGRGYAGVVKRHHFAGGPKTHGQADRWRHAGSMGQTTTPGRVYKGKRMSGHMGVEKISLRTRILEVQNNGKTLLVYGPVPGSVGSNVLIKKI
jgi:large subunit ribosomal protein L3